MRIYDIIAKKRDGGSLSREELAFFVDRYVKGEIPDYQAAALTMAICLRGMDERETIDLTSLMTVSGDTVDLSEFGDTTVDKHSTGGVGDKTTLIIAPVASSLGATVAKLSGRGLGHTGGTVDKLESVPGFCTELAPEAFRKQLHAIGLAIAGQSGNFVPADKKLYALRDSTATVESLPLIASSVMCKKLATGARSLVLDVKAGRGAFMKTPEAATELAALMKKIGESCGRRVSALVTDMNIPLGRAVGNATEMREALAVLRGEIAEGALFEVSVALASRMVSLSLHKSVEESEDLVKNTLQSGRALERFAEMVEWQGGDPRAVYDPTRLPVAAYCQTVCAPRDGYLAELDAGEVGVSSLLLGAGRQKKGDPIDPAAGLILHKSPGEYVRAGEPLTTLYASSPSLFAESEKRFLSAVVLSEEPPAPRPLLLRVL